jgi:glycosyltransferase involved in cell wall biosynthesis
MTTPRVLLVTYSFPPAGGVGVLRAASLARHLPAAGLSVEVLTAANAAAVGSDEALLRQIAADVKIHRTLTLDLPFAWRKRLKQWLSGRKKTTNRRQNGKQQSGLLKRILQAVLLPDPQVTWLPIAYYRACRLIARQPIDIVVITVPPFSCAMLVKRLRRRFPALPIVLDFRDEWLTTTIDLVSFSQDERARRIATRAEAGAVAAATTVVMVTQAARREIRARYPSAPAGKFEVIPNGFDPAPPAVSCRADAKQEGRILITFAGTLYRSTDPAPVIAAIRALPVEIKDRFQLRFIGYVEDPAYREQILSLSDCVELHGFVPHNQAIAAIQQSDYVLLITHDRINVPAKFYDYIGGRRPILAAVHADSEVRELMDELGTGWWADIGDAEQIARLFTSAVQRGRSLNSDFLPDEAKIARFERQALSLRYAALLRKAAAQGAPSTHAASLPVATGEARGC